MKTKSFKELGSANFRIAQKLSMNQRLSRLLKYTDNQPLDKEAHPDWDIYEENLFTKEKNIRLIPYVDVHKESDGIVVINTPEGTPSENDEFSSLNFTISVFTQIDTWEINEENLRPFLIMEEIVGALDRQNITSIGQMIFEGFDMNVVSDNVACHNLYFSAHGYR